MGYSDELGVGMKICECECAMLCGRNTDAMCHVESQVIEIKKNRRKEIQRKGCVGDLDAWRRMDGSGRWNNKEATETQKGAAFVTSSLTLALSHDHCSSAVSLSTKGTPPRFCQFPHALHDIPGQEYSLVVLFITCELLIYVL